MEQMNQWLFGQIGTIVLRATNIVHRAPEMLIVRKGDCIRSAFPFLARGKISKILHLKDIEANKPLCEMALNSEKIRHFGISAMAMLAHTMIEETIDHQCVANGDRWWDDVERLEVIGIEPAIIRMIGFGIARMYDQNVEAREFMDKTHTDGYAFRFSPEGDSVTILRRVRRYHNTARHDATTDPYFEFVAIEQPFNNLQH